MFALTVVNPMELDALKQMFKDGRHAEAIAGCEALSRKEPRNDEIKRLCATMHGMVGDYARSLELLHEIRNPAREEADLLFNIAVCERELDNFKGAAKYFGLFTKLVPHIADGWASLAQCKFRLNTLDEAIALADQAIVLDPCSVPAWTVRGHAQKSLREFDAALASYAQANRVHATAEAHLHSGLVSAELGKLEQAIESFDKAVAMAPELPSLRMARAESLVSAGRISEAVADYRLALALAPDDAEALKKATARLLESGGGDQAIELCREILQVRPDNLTARLGAEWILSQLVPLWHIPMMNEQERNKAFHDGLAAVVSADKLVFEIGTGSGLLAMMAARQGAAKVITCEAVVLIADTAKRIIERNGYADRITVLTKPSQAVQIGSDLPRKADILLHEIFSSELLGEHVLPAIEDARTRLLAPDGIVLPSAASIMIALVGGDALGKSLYVGENFGFDLSDFNAIHPKKRPLYREDLAPTLLSAEAEAFRFAFAMHSSFPAEKKHVPLTATQSGLCYGVIQWIRLELGQGIWFENHPSRPRAVSNWQHMIYGFDKPIQLEEGAVVSISAMHDRSRPWFSLIDPPA